MEAKYLITIHEKIFNEDINEFRILFIQNNN